MVVDVFVGEVVDGLTVTVLAVSIQEQAVLRKDPALDDKLDHNDALASTVVVVERVVEAVVVTFEVVTDLVVEGVFDGVVVAFVVVVDFVVLGVFDGVVLALAVVAALEVVVELLLGVVVSWRLALAAAVTVTTGRG